MKHRPGIRDIAEQTGLSVGTVSMILNNKAEKFSEITRTRVLETARQLDYRPNLAGRRLRSDERETLYVGLAVGASPRTATVRAIFDAAQWCANHCATPIQLTIEPYVGNRLCDLPGLQDGLRFNGLIVANCLLADMEFLATHELAVPVVLFNREHQGCHYVATTNLASGRMAAELFLRQGRRYPYVLHYQRQGQSTERRRQGFLQAVREAGMSPLELAGAAQSERSGYEAMTTLLARGCPCDAVYAVTDAIAIGAMCAIREAGRRIPEDIAVIGHDDEPASAYTAPPLATFRMPMEQMAQDAVSSLVRILTGEISGLVQRTYPTELVVRQST